MGWWGSLVTVTALVLATAPPSAAHSWGPGNSGGPSSTHGIGVQFADSRSHTFCYGQLDAITTAAANDARVNALDIPTDIRTSFDCPNATVDVLVNDDGYSDNWFGLYTCNILVAAGSDQCQRATVYLNTRTVGTVQARRSKTLCHEFGHSVGLRHFDLGSPGTNNSEPSCMVSGVSTWTRYSGHEEYTSHIDGRY